MAKHTRLRQRTLLPEQRVVHNPELLLPTGALHCLTRLQREGVNPLKREIEEGVRYQPVINKVALNLSVGTTCVLPGERTLKVRELNQNNLRSSL
jgi:hypothetical protein